MSKCKIAFVYRWDPNERFTHSENIPIYDWIISNNIVHHNDSEKNCILFSSRAFDFEIGMGMRFCLKNEWITKIELFTNYIWVMRKWIEKRFFFSRIHFNHDVQIGCETIWGNGIYIVDFEFNSTSKKMKKNLKLEIVKPFLWIRVKYKRNIL